MWCAAVAGLPAAAQHNLGFEEVDERSRPAGWSASDGAAVTTDATVAAAGQHSLKVIRSAAAGVTRVTQRMPAASLAGARVADAKLVDEYRRVRLAGLVRAPAAMAAAVWLRIDGPRGALFLDSYGYGQEPTLETEPARRGGGSDDDDTAWQRYEIELPLPADVEEIAFGVSARGEGAAWFDALELTALAADSQPPARPAAVRYLEAALELMREHSLRRAAIDWRALREQSLEYARGATTAADTHVAVRYAVRELGDRHSYLQSAAATRTLQNAAVSNARTGAAPLAPSGRPLAGAGYIRVPSFAGGTPVQQVEFAESLKTIIQEHDETGVCGWIVDLRQNSGGNLWPMLAGLGPLLGEGEVAASVYPDGRRVSVWYRDGQAGFGDYTQLRVRSPYRLRAAKPTAVLIGAATASSAEVLAVAFGSRDGVRSFGAATRGLSAGNRTFPLEDGASLVLTVAATSDAAGRIFAGPLVPDEPVGAAEGSGSSAGDAADALDAAVAWLTAGDACR